MTQEASREIQVYDYLDYRAYLRDFYLGCKTRPNLSHRGFSPRAGSRSPKYLQLVIDGKRNLTDAMARRFAKAIGLDRDAAEYWVELVRFNQTKTITEREAAYRRMTGFRGYCRARPLDGAQADYYAHWYIPAVRELAISPGFREDHDWIAKALIPTITPEDAARALRVLTELGLLVRGEDGQLLQGDPLVSTGPEARSVLVARYHRTMLERAAAAIDLVPASERDISSLTLCLGSHGLCRIKERIRRFRAELLELSTLEQNPDQVVQVNFQLFPLTRQVGGSKRNESRT
jgi:uncharacterized protein (TIGR02147 family)